MTNAFADELFDFVCNVNRTLAQQFQSPQPPHELEKVDSREVYQEDPVP
jgi:hypothetical protein